MSWYLQRNCFHRCVKIPACCLPATEINRETQRQEIGTNFTTYLTSFYLDAVPGPWGGSVFLEVNPSFEFLPEKSLLGGT